jgi:hypothetical protein
MVRLLMLTLPPLLAMYVPTCVPRAVSPSVPPAQVQIEELWQQRDNLQSQDLLYGPWGVERAPDPEATYRFVEMKRGGVNPGMTVRDPAGRVWKVKQPAMDGRIAEGPIEVVLSRVLSAVGYHQPPVYYVPDFALEDKAGTRRVPGGRFRLVDGALKDRGEWSWQRNPFVGTRPYQGLLVILFLFNSSDLKNANNTLYEYRGGDRLRRWYVVRDLGTSLGGTGRITPQRGDVERFERDSFITGVEGGFVTFDYHGWHQELVRRRITPSDVRWACALLSQLTPTQWREAFLAGGYDTQLAGRFIGALQARIRQGLTLAEGDGGPTS